LAETGQIPEQNGATAKENVTFPRQNGAANQCAAAFCHATDPEVYADLPAEKLVLGDRYLHT